MWMNMAMRIVFDELHFKRRLKAKIAFGCVFVNYVVVAFQEKVESYFHLEGIQPPLR